MAAVATKTSQILLRDVTPNEVLVTHHWNAILRPNYSHAHEGQNWTTVSIRGQQQQQHSQGFKQCRSTESAGKVLTAPYTNASSPDYQASRAVDNQKLAGTGGLKHDREGARVTVGRG